MSVLLYAVETETMLTSEDKTLEAFRMKCQGRNIKSYGRSLSTTRSLQLLVHIVVYHRSRIRYLSKKIREF